MESDKKNSQETSRPEKDYVRKIQVTNRFKEMMVEAHLLQKKIIEARLSQLERWNSVDQSQFSQVFGFDGSEQVKDFYTTATSNNIIELKTARKLVLDGVLRMKEVCENITADNFINITDSGDYFAKVEETQTIALPVARYKSDLKISIGHKFVGAPMFGADSKICTLCHEMSHLIRYKGSSDSGGMGTQDLYGKNKPRDNAVDMRNRKDSNVFRNAYNIELYFEIDIS